MKYQLEEDYRFLCECAEEDKIAELTYLLDESMERTRQGTLSQEEAFYMIPQVTALTKPEMQEKASRIMNDFIDHL